MSRKKVKLAWIENANARKAAFKKRSIGLLKKVRELSILCDIDAFAIIYHPNDAKLTMWPSRHEIQPILERFGGIPTVERNKNMKNEVIYAKEKLQKLQDRLKECQLRNQEGIASQLMQQMEQGKELDDFCYKELLTIFWYMEEKKEKINMMIDYIKQSALISRFFNHQALCRNLVDETTQVEGINISESEKSNYFNAISMDQHFKKTIYKSNNIFENDRSQSDLFALKGNINIDDDKESDCGTDLALELPDGEAENNVNTMKK